MSELAASVREVWNRQPTYVKQGISAGAIYSISHIAGFGYSFFCSASKLMLGGPGLVILYLGNEVWRDNKKQIKEVGQVLIIPEVGQAAVVIWISSAKLPLYPPYRSWDRCKSPRAASHHSPI